MRSWKSVTAIVAALYAASWLVTAVVGVDAAKRSAIRQMVGSMPMAEVASLNDVTSQPAIAIRAVAWAPFFVVVDYDYRGLIDCGEGATVRYVTLPWFVRSVSKSVHWMA